MRTILRRALPRTVAAGFALGVPLLSAGCSLDRLLEVEDTDVIVPGAVDGPEALPTVLAGALFDFQSAFGGQDLTAGLVVSTGLLADEFYSSDTNSDRTEIDTRIIRRINGQVRTAFLNTQQARVSARRTHQLVERAGIDNPSAHVLAYALEGYAETLLAENFCSGVPVSAEVDGRLEFGDPQTTAELLASAVGRFDAALGIAGAPAARRNLASVGRGRALLGLGRYAEAAAAVAAVPTGFLYAVEHSDNSPAQRNSVFALQGNFRISVSNREGGSGLAFREAADPRVPWRFANRTGFDRVTPLHLQLLYPSYGADIPLASGIEARLIEAEAALAQGASAAYLPILNALRAGVDLAPLADPGTPAARVDQLFRERAFWLYATGHRLSDLRRLVRQYGRAADQVFPSGSYHKEGRTYGTDVNFPIPIEEENNPLSRGGTSDGCLNRDA